MVTYNPCCRSVSSEELVFSLTHLLQSNGGRDVFTEEQALDLDHSLDVSPIASDCPEGYNSLPTSIIQTIESQLDDEGNNASPCLSLAEAADDVSQVHIPARQDIFTTYTRYTRQDCCP